MECLVLVRPVIAIGLLLVTQPSAVWSQALPATELPLVVPSEAAQDLDGTWLVQSVKLRGKSFLAQAWTSTLTVSKGAFTASNFCTSTQNLNGRFLLGATSTSASHIDLEFDSVDLSEVWDGVCYPAFSSPGIYKIEEDTLTLCFQVDANPTRPESFDIKDKRTVLLKLVKAKPGFEFPKEVSVQVVDSDDRPVANAVLYRFMSLFRTSENDKTPPEWKYQQIGTTSSDGTAKVAYQALESGLAARSHNRKLSAWADISPASLRSGTVQVKLAPECHVRGTIVCDGLAKIGKPLDWTNAIVLRDEQRIGMCSVVPGEFEFYLPPGKYKVNAYGAELVKGEFRDITVPNERELLLPPIQLSPTPLALLIGKPAPELKNLLGWHGKPVSLAEQRGNYVLIDFWGYWCGPCVAQMPVLIDLHERFNGKGLTIIGVHVDTLREVDTAEKLDQKIAGHKKNLWQERDLPFSNALTGESSFADIPVQPGTPVEQYGIQGYPTTILIDREGKVVGSFEIDDSKKTIARIEKLLED